MQNTQIICKTRVFVLVTVTVIGDTPTMADTICRTLRDGGLEGEHAPALTIKDSIASPFGLDVFTHVLTQLSNYILAGKSQSRSLPLTAPKRVLFFLFLFGFLNKIVEFQFVILFYCKNAEVS